MDSKQIRLIYFEFSRILYALVEHYESADRPKSNVAQEEEEEEEEKEEEEE